MLGEVWQRHPIFDRYKVSNRGRVYRMSRMVVRSDGIVCNRKGAFVMQQLRDDGYRELTLFHDRGRHGYNRLVHVLVLETFVGLRQEGMECRHLNGKRDENCLENLCWGTPHENWEDKKRHGTLPGPFIGEMNGNSKLTESEVRMMLKLRKDQGMKGPELAKMFGCGESTAYKILSGALWGWIER